jgi:pyruvate dehydrogenase E1 component alpha subunit
MPAAVGAALSARLRGTDQVCLCFFGDGAANSGPFHESLNLAAIWKLPVIFLCENNGYAICSSQAQTTAVADIASRAVSYEFPGAVVDGQDVIAVYDIVSTAVARARAGEGPTLLEAKTYRYCDHQEVDFLWPGYRSGDEIRSWQSRDPIEILVGRLIEQGHLTAGEIDAVRREVEVEVREALLFAENSPVPDPKALFEDVFV